MLVQQQLGEELGSGAFGTVFKAVDVHRGTIVALKRIHTANLLPEEIADVEVGFQKKWFASRNLAVFNSYIHTCIHTTHLDRLKSRSFAPWSIPT